MGISGTNEATQSVPFGTDVAATGDATANGTSGTVARSNHAHKGVVANEAWTAWTPTLTNLTLGNGAVVARFTRIGRTVYFSFRFTFGSTSAVAGDVSISPPVDAVTTMTVAGHCRYTDADGPEKFGQCLIGAAASLILRGFSTAGSEVALSSTAPFTWATGDVMDVSGFYEAAS